MGATKKICGISSLLVFRQNFFKKMSELLKEKNLFFISKKWQFCL